MFVVVRTSTRPVFKSKYKSSWKENELHATHNTALCYAQQIIPYFSILYLIFTLQTISVFYLSNILWEFWIWSWGCSNLIESKTINFWMKSITQHFFEILGMRFLAKKILRKINSKLENQEKLDFLWEVANFQF